MKTREATEITQILEDWTIHSWWPVGHWKIKETIKKNPRRNETWKHNFLELCDTIKSLLGP